MTRCAYAIHYICAHSKVDANLVSAACKIIEAAPKNEQVELFVRFLYECKYTPTDKSETLYEEFKEDISKEEKANARRKIDAFMVEYKKIGMCESDFYKKLYEFIIDESGGDYRKQAILVMACVQNHCLPYVDESDVLTMSQDEFEEAESKLDQLYNGMVKHLSLYNFSQVTQLASKYVPILEMAKNNKEKSILLALMLMRFRAKTSMPSLEEILGDA